MLHNSIGARNFMESLSTFLGFFGDKEKLLKVLLTCTLIP